jgi:hypothetical protein
MPDLSTLSIPELRSLIAEIDELLPHKQEVQWVDNVRSLEEEALDAIEELRRLTGRNYALTLSGYPVHKKK